MGSAAKLNVCVVWANELRIAAASVRRLNEALRRKASGEELSNAVNEVLFSCHTALRGVENARNIVVCEGEAVDFVTAPETPARKQEDDDGN